MPSLFAQQAQNREPHIGYVFPAGGQRGTTFEINVGGQFLDGARDAVVSGSGLRVTVVSVNKPLPEKRFNEMREALEAARKRFAAFNAPPSPPAKPAASAPASSPKPIAAVSSPSPKPIAAVSSPSPKPIAAAPSPSPNPVASASSPSPKPLASGTSPSPAPIASASAAPSVRPMRPLHPEMVVEILKEFGATDAEISKFLELRKQRNDPKRQQNQQLALTVTLKVEIAANAQTGPCDLRLITPQGLTNPLAFCVGNLPESSGDGLIGKTFDTATRVALPVVLNGQIFPGAVHHFSFQARRGAHLVVLTQGRDLMPYLADTVPGWFQPAVAIYDAKGNQMAYGDHFRFNPDPVLSLQVPEDGIYLLEIRDSLYRGREDFVYRVSVGEIPFITDIFPLGGQVGSQGRVALSGWNLPHAEAVFSPAYVQGIYAIPALSNGLATSDPVFAFDALPQCVEQKPGNSPNLAQRVTLPIVINGRIDHPGDIHGFAFTCQAGQKVVAEVYARRLNSSLDSWLKVVDAKGHQLAFNDDCEDKGAGFLTHCSDSRLTFTAPASAEYYLLLGDSESKGGPDYTYRLRLSAPMPDFALRVVPSGINARPGVSVPITVYALRKDGFAGDISLALKSGSSGVLLDGGRIPAGKDRVRATLTFPPAPIGDSVILSMEGRSSLQGRDIVRPAVPADDMVQAFMYHHLVPARQMIAEISGTNHGRAPIKMLRADTMTIKAGGTGQAVLSLQGRPLFTLPDTVLQLSEPPDGISIQGTSATGDGTAITFKADATKVKAGEKGNLIVEAFVERTPPAINGKVPEKKRVSIGYLPAIPFDVVLQ